MKQSGIYEILNTVNGKRYIGSAVSITRRWREHRSELRRGVSGRRHLQNAWNKYGEQSFKFRVLGLCAPEHLTFFEQQWMGARKPEYNKAPVAGSTLGVVCAPETRAKISKRMTGQKRGPYSAEHRANIGWGQLGNKRGPRSPEWTRKQSLAHTGKKKPPRTAEHSAAISKAKTGKRLGIPWSEIRLLAQHQHNQASLGWIYGVKI